MLRKIGIDDIIQVNSGYSWSPAEKDELKWKTIPRATAIKAYQKYFADFVIFGYSTDDVIPFINESDPNLGKINMVQLSIFGPGIWSQWRGQNPTTPRNSTISTMSC